MRLSVDEITTLKGLEGSIILAGSRGSQNIVEHVVVMSDGPREEGILEKALVLMSATRVPSEATCRDLMQHGVTALALVGPECPVIPQEFKSFCDDYSFPVLYIPGGSDVALPAVSVLNEIVFRSNKEAQYRRSIHERFTRIAMGRDCLDALATTLYQLIGCPVAIYDMHLEQRILVPQDHPPLAGYRLEMLPEELLKMAWQPVRLNVSSPERPLNLVITAIVVDELTYGYLVVDETGNRLQGTDLVAVDHATIILALELVKEKAASDALQNLRNDLLDEILNAEVDEEVRKNLILRSRALGWDLERQYIAIALGIDGVEKYYNEDSSGGSIPWRVCMDTCLKLVRDQARKMDPTAIVASHSDSIILLSSVDPTQPRNKIMERLSSLVSSMQRKINASLDGIGLTAGIGESIRSLLEIGPSFREAREALLYGRTVFGRGSIVHFSDLGIYRLLFRFSQREDLEAFFERTIGKLMQYDTKQNSRLVDTLEALVENNGHMQRTANSLFIHYNTLKYRLQKIKEITGEDWDQLEGRLNLQVGLKLKRVLGKT